ncbi:hypothetical protein C8F04DRAFT_642396 [Mycena alexandri]|uniref:C2H2-type domain-containing protein n=1 Tax=Mycena alexandri TaxID=1745969 RepID=A0AAD6TE25_9AGAR|nr:hypothetical protein C8F04DRAFT_642396 [Mycena alexandri]
MDASGMYNDKDNEHENGDLDAEGEMEGDSAGGGMTLVDAGGLGLPSPPSGSGNGSALAGGGVGKRYRPAPAKTFQCRGYGECRMVFSRSEHLARHVRFVQPSFLFFESGFFGYGTAEFSFLPPRPPPDMPIHIADDYPLENTPASAPSPATAPSSSRASITCASTPRRSMLTRVRRWVLCFSPSFFWRGVGRGICWRLSCLHPFSGFFRFSSRLPPALPFSSLQFTPHADALARRTKP